MFPVGVPLAKASESTIKTSKQEGLACRRQFMNKEVDLGLRENLGQFILLVIVNAFVGGMVGLERSILPQIAEVEFHIAAKTAILSFIVVFGITKALTNYFTGALANRFGRRNLLIAGWLVGIPVPFILMFAPDWNWIVGANVLLGINQGITWSSTVVMKIDLVGERNRGLAMGLNATTTATLGGVIGEWLRFGIPFVRERHQYIFFGN